ncbi:E3 ubiquitin-protein ligase RMA3-like [Juglans microcarpa x Juglans regia]|uniref:E3 ubiquitin-protein ligase RMA3-like n=1 Tax=Juglans microcarpa x Juglans regia TaxID=2249226 RepID=UPI001B7E08F9|nr:E3 ubiquitin-protein ligase RMA3-like [Juglans microcarpa x Juglans regia]
MENTANGKRANSPFIYRCVPTLPSHPFRFFNLVPKTRKERQRSLPLSASLSSFLKSFLLTSFDSDILLHTSALSMEHNSFEPELHFESTGDVSFPQKWKSMSAPTTDTVNEDGCFGCNICLEPAQEPVVTLCGHLYCWPCIYKWINVQISSDEPEHQQPKCPVCKANISQNLLVPLYGRGTSSSDSNVKKSNLGPVIPRRPPPCGLHNLISSTQQRPNGSAYIGDTAMVNPAIGMFGIGERVYARIFGSTNTSLYACPLTEISSPRMRRQEMKFDKSLNRVSIFLFCCIILCLLLF